MVGIYEIQSFFNIYGSTTDILLNFVLPIPVVAYALYLFLGEIKILKSPTPRALLGIAMSVMLIAFFKIGSMALWGGIFGILLLKIKNLPGRIMGIVIFVFIVSQITSFNLANPNTQTLFMIIFGVVMLFALISTESWKKQIFIVIILLVVYMIFTTYFLAQVRI